MTDSEAQKQEATFEHGVKDMRLTAVIVLENAATGSNRNAVLRRRIAHRNPSLLPGKHPGVSLRRPCGEVGAGKCMIRALGDLWLENHDAVLFHEGNLRVTAPALRSHSRTVIGGNQPDCLTDCQRVGHSGKRQQINNTRLEYAEIEHITPYMKK